MPQAKVGYGVGNDPVSQRSDRGFGEREPQEWAHGLAGHRDFDGFQSI